MLHQTVWFKGNISFNESLASFVGEHGTLAYLQQQYGVDAPEYQHSRALRADALVFGEYMDAAHRAPRSALPRAISRADKLQRKAQIFGRGSRQHIRRCSHACQTTGYRNFLSGSL